MKKHFRLVCMMCLAGTLAFFASSCKKNEEKQAIQVILPEFEEVAGEPSEEDKAYLDFNQSGKFFWNGGDSIMVYNIDNRAGETSEKSIYVTEADAEGQQEARFFYGDGDQITPRKNHYFVFYPVNRIATGLAHLDHNNREYFNIPTEQKYVLDPNGNPTVDKRSMALAVETDRLNKPFSLKHIYGICRLRLTGSAKVKKIEIIDDFVHLTGSVSMKLHQVNMTTFSQLIDESLYTWANVSNHGSSYYQQWFAYNELLGYAAESDEMGNRITLNCVTEDFPEGVQLTSDVKPFYIMLRPGALIGGFTIKIYTNSLDEPSHEITKYLQPKDSYCIRAGMITGFKPGISID